MSFTVFFYLSSNDKNKNCGKFVTTCGSILDTFESKVYAKQKSKKTFIEILHKIFNIEKKYSIQVDLSLLRATHLRTVLTLREFSTICSSL
jgi:heterodisulfide reductase subunit A-like polyferredoxin